ncbi:hypothetical protein MY11210_005155 [Beauveria gryllotalpidicola]
MKIPYVPNPPETTTPEDAAIVARIQARRAPRPLIPLDLALLHAPPVADGWNSFLSAIRTQTSLPDDVRELAICRVAACNKAWFEWAHHAPLAVQGGVRAAAMDVVRAEALPEARPAALLSDKQWAVLRYTDEMTRRVQVEDEVFKLVRAHFDDRETVEITATVSAYNCVSRFLVALDVGEKNGMGPDDVAAH